MIYALAEPALTSEADSSYECIACYPDQEAPALGGSGLLVEEGEAEVVIAEAISVTPDPTEPAHASTLPEDQGALPATPLWKELHLWNKCPLAQP